MKTRNKMSIIALIAIITLAIIGCGGDNTATETFTVTFHANGGSQTPAPQTVEKGKTAAEPTGVTKANNTLDGWYKESGFTTKWNFADDTVTANIDLYAKWNCNCPNGTEHLFGQPCCEGASCNCKVYYGVLPNGVKIYKGEGVTDEQTLSAVPNAIAGYNSMRPEFGSPDGKFNKLIILTADVPYTWKNSVLGVGCEAPDSYFRTRFEKMADGSLAETQ